MSIFSKLKLLDSGSKYELSLGLLLDFLLIFGDLDSADAIIMFRYFISELHLSALVKLPQTPLPQVYN